MDHLALELVGKTDDLDRIELTFVDTDSATLADRLRDDGFTLLSEGDAFCDTCPHEGTEVDALLVAFSVLASIVKDRGYPHDASNREVINKHSVAHARGFGVIILTIVWYFQYLAHIDDIFDDILSP